MSCRAADEEDGLREGTEHDREEGGGGVPTLEEEEGGERHAKESSSGALVAGAPVAASSVAQGGLSLVDFQEVVVVPSAPCETATPVLTPIGEWTVCACGEWGWATAGPSPLS